MAILMEKIADKSQNKNEATKEFAEKFCLDKDKNSFYFYRQNLSDIEKTMKSLVDDTKDLLKELYVKQSLWHFPKHIHQNKMLKKLKAIYLKEKLNLTTKFDYNCFDESWKNSDIPELKNSFEYKQKVDKAYNEYQIYLDTIEKTIKSFDKKYDVEKEIEKFYEKQAKKGKVSDFPGMGSTEAGPSFFPTGDGGGIYM